MYTFDAGGYESGELRAEGLIGDRVAAVHTVRTPGAPHHIEVVVPPYPVDPVADGSDMIPVYFMVCDADGTWINTSQAEIEITVSGEGRLIGDGIRRIGVNPQQVEGGIGFAFVRTTRKAGRICIEARSAGLGPGRTVVRSRRFCGSSLADGGHAPFSGDEEDGVVVKPTRWDRAILERPKVAVASVEVTSEQAGYAKSNIVDGDDFSWWIAGGDTFPQTVTLTLAQATDVAACRIRLQKDSSSYEYRVESSEDGLSWQPLYSHKCTGWDFKPVRIDKRMKYFRVTFDATSGGRAGLAEITLYE